jgi:excisionase family DNA binding protein
VSIREFTAMTGLGRTSTYREIREGRLKVRKVGRRTLIPMDEVQAWMSALEPVAPRVA